MQMTALKARTTPAQQRRRHERITRRAHVWTAPVAVQRVRFIDRLRAIGQRLAFRKVNREKAEALAGMVARYFERLRLRSALTDRCSFRRVYVENGREKQGDPCGGKLRAHRRLLDPTTRELQCVACGRVYQDVRTVAA